MVPDVGVSIALWEGVGMFLAEYVTHSTAWNYLQGATTLPHAERNFCIEEKTNDKPLIIKAIKLILDHPKEREREKDKVRTSPSKIYNLFCEHKFLRLI